MGGDGDGPEEGPEDHVRDKDGGEERGEGFSDDELFRLDWRGEDRFERALLSFSDHGVGGENGGDYGGRTTM